MLLRTMLVLALVPAGASAHAILMQSQPAAGASVPAGSMPVTVRFNSRIDHARSRLTLRQNQSDTVLPLSAGTAPDVSWSLPVDVDLSCRFRSAAHLL